MLFHFLYCIKTIFRVLQDKVKIRFIIKDVLEMILKLEKGQGLADEKETCDF